MLKTVRPKILFLWLGVCGAFQCDTTTSCPDTATCCQLTDGTYGCCPYASAVCCSDQVHCCPQHTQCDLEAQSCDSGDGLSDWAIPSPGIEVGSDDDNVSWARKSPAGQDGSVVCGDGHSSCPDDSTCCLLVSGQYGCCPMPNAVCCEDEIHCCPAGTQCDVVEGKCVRKWRSSLFRWGQRHLPSLTQHSTKDPVECDDGKSVCAARTTCCQLPGGLYGCCPMVEAVCCDDEIHCCPQSTTCDTAAGMCRSDDGRVMSAWHAKIAAGLLTSSHPRLTKCSRGNKSCAEGLTCCLLDGHVNFGCCPFPDAICCHDGRHCCPSDSVCNPLRHSCDQSNGGSVRWFSPSSGSSVLEGADVVICQNGVNACPSGTKCCPADSHGDYRCCPLATGICCPAGHCCPAGLECRREGCGSRRSFNFLAFLRESAERSQQQT